MSEDIKSCTEYLKEYLDRFTYLSEGSHTDLSRAFLSGWNACAEQTRQNIERSTVLVDDEPTPAEAFVAAQRKILRNWPDVPAPETVDPGEGYRLLEVGEMIKEGDECRNFGGWVKSACIGSRYRYPGTHVAHRRSIFPRSVPGFKAGTWFARNKLPICTPPIWWRCYVNQPELDTIGSYDDEREPGWFQSGGSWVVPASSSGYDTLQALNLIPWDKSCFQTKEDG